VILPSHPRPLLAGERINAQGSRRAKRLLLADDYGGIVDMGREQVAAGAHLLDVFVAMPERQDEAALMAAVVQRLSATVGVPLMIDSTQPGVFARALEDVPRSAILNSVSLQQGRGVIDAVVPMALAHDAALVALTIDETGMATTAARKLAIARRIHDIVVGAYGLAADALLIDPLTFTLAAGKAEWIDTAHQTIEAIRTIKRELPRVLTIVGVSDVSFGLTPPARAVLNSVFLHLCADAGLDVAIVDPSRIRAVVDLEKDERRLAEDVLFNRAPDALRRFAGRFSP
jgi:5-methyltetrahydrofolate--homocysteine methyltransferase